MSKSSPKFLSARIIRFFIGLSATAILVVSVAAWFTSIETLPPKIRIAAGKPGGLYDTFAQRFKEILIKKIPNRTIEVIATTGTEANVELLREGKAELAIIQTDSWTLQGVVGIAPLFPEPVHFLVNKNKRKEIKSVADLKGKRVALGSAGSGMLLNARTVLAQYGLKPTDLEDAVEPFRALANDPNLDAAFVTTGWMNPLLTNILKQGQWELVGIADAEGLARRHPWFAATTIPQGLFPGKSPVPPEAVPTVAVTALLAGQENVSDRLVRESLAALFESDLRMAFPSLQTANAAKDYDAAVMHPEVANYHNPNAGLNRIATTLDFFSKSKELLVAVMALGFLIWNWARRRRERAATAADQMQKEKLEGFIQKTLEVELEQMEVTDPEELRTFLRRVTHIKQGALLELTSEKVRGDQLFAIFLAQCAALSDKIQMRMMYGRLSGA